MAPDTSSGKKNSPGTPGGHRGQLAQPAGRDAVILVELRRWGTVLHRDASALAALYTDGAVLLPQGHPTPITGRADIEKFFDGWMKQKLANASIPFAEAKMLDQKTLYAAGTWSGEAPGEKGASSSHLRGTYLMVAVQDGSSWRLQADTWNMMPPSGAQPATATAPTTQGSGATAPAK